MPELPEVETTKKDLSKKIILEKVKGCWVGLPNRTFIRSDFKKRDYSEIIKGGKIENVYRKGKNIIIDLSNGVSILMHQKISGHILFGKWQYDSGKWISKDKLLAQKINSFIYFIIFLTNGNMIALSDPRKFFKVEFWKKEDLEESQAIKELGPDALEIDLKRFQGLLGKRKQGIKKLLLNQSFISGIGNIYSDEMLWDAAISPFRKANSLKEDETKKLFKSMRKILKESLRYKGDSTSDYRLITGEEGSYQKRHKVYQRDGEKCPRNDGGIIKREKFGNRSLRYCPICQK